jgi:hypothetical protein
MNKKNGMATIWTILITFLIMAGLAGGGYYYLSGKQKKDTDDLKNQINTLTAQLAELKKAAPAATSTDSELKTYLNKYYNYSFKYPATDSLIDYLYDTQTNSKIEYGKFVVVDKKAIAENALRNQSEFPMSYLIISASSEQFGLSSISSGLSNGEKIQDVVVGGEKGWKIVFTEPSALDGSYSTSIYVNHGSYGYTISWKNDDASGSHDPAIDAIVTSFQFTS